MDYIGIIENDTGLEEAREIIIYGAGNVGRYSFHYLRQKKWEKKVICFCDNNKDIQGKRIEGVPVLSVRECCERYEKGIYLVASMSVRQMAESLLQYGIEHIHIIRQS